jgi:hypothetical protein
MFIEYTDRTFDKRLVQVGCVGLDYEYENRSQFYKAPLGIYIYNSSFEEYTKRSFSFFKVRP